MTWSNPVCDCEKPRHELWSDNQTGEEIVKSNENASKNLGSGHATDQAHEGLSEIGINSKIEGEDTLG